MGIVGIKRLNVQTIIGLLPHERIYPQQLLLDIEMTVHFEQCIQDRTEDLSQSVDYSEVAKNLTTWIQESKFELIESIALEGTKRLLESFPNIEHCKITVLKPEAIPEADAAMVSWQRSRFVEHLD